MSSQIMFNNRVGFRVDKLLVNGREAKGAVIYHGLREYIFSSLIADPDYKYPEAHIYYNSKGKTIVVFTENGSQVGLLEFPRNTVILQEFKEV